MKTIPGLANAIFNSVLLPVADHHPLNTHGVTSNIRIASVFVVVATIVLTYVLLRGDRSVMPPHTLIFRDINNPPPPLRLHVPDSLLIFFLFVPEFPVELIPCGHGPLRFCFQGGVAIVL